MSYIDPGIIAAAGFKLLNKRQAFNPVVRSCMFIRDIDMAATGIGQEKVLAEVVEVIVSCAIQAHYCNQQNRRYNAHYPQGKRG